MRSAVRPLAEARYHATDSEGRAGHGGGHWLVLEAGDCGAERGLCLAVFLESGVFHDVRVDGDADGRGLVTMSNGAADLAGYLLFSADGENGLMRAAHGLVRTELPAQRDSRGPRKVHLNTWEALGFDMDEASCLRLVDDAAAIGAERFVLDDGWFRGRRDDRTSLGDWTVDADRFPNGLTPLIERCRAKGLDFGLWVEPEMVSPDSELARAHPEWIIGGPDAPTQRNQLMLDLTRDDARAFVFESIDRLLRENDIAYLKWDHNRPLLSASEADEAALSQVGAQMMRDLRRAHPGLEIEACASGGGRIDYEMLRHCRRVWPSDNNDAVERLRIIREWSRFIPLDVLGNHVGPSPNPVTGRRLDMDFRAKVAMFGHMGVEADPGAMTADERDVLAAHIALYKAWRGVIHGGDLYHLRFADAGQTGFLCLAEEGARGLALAARTDFAAKHEGEPVRLPGLAADAGYRVRLLEPWPDKARRYLSNATKWREGIVLPGQAMMTSGLALPLTHPETAWLIALERVG
ncbi:MAG: alpha-galactosidase [Pacificimonas sp.]|jgi:alpha-galactosidase|nr:alpha-galactosidase [Pacificimonas sp.]